jgi:hypothetical protein
MPRIENGGGGFLAAFLSPKVTNHLDLSLFHWKVLFLIENTSEKITTKETLPLHP